MSARNTIAALLGDMLRVADFIPRGFAQPYERTVRELDEIEAGYCPVGRDIFVDRWPTTRTGQ